MPRHRKQLSHCSSPATSQRLRHQSQTMGYHQHRRDPHRCLNEQTRHLVRLKIIKNTKCCKVKKNIIALTDNRIKTTTKSAKFIMYTCNKRSKSVINVKSRCSIHDITVTSGCVDIAAITKDCCFSGFTMPA